MDQKIGDDEIASILVNGESLSDYAFFFNVLTDIAGGFRHTGDVHYCLFRFLWDGRRDRLIRGLLRSVGRRVEGDMLVELDVLRSEPVSALSIPPVMFERYQDIWINGQAIVDGVRECDGRYHIISSYLRRFKRRFSVLDLGCNLGYFSTRIAEDFDAVCVCAESTYTFWLSQILNANASRNIYALNHRFTLEDLKLMACSEQFDIVLGLSVLHHIEAPSSEVLDALKGLGRHVIIELPTEDQACGGKWLDAARGLDTSNFTLLGYGKSHLGGEDRPIYVCEGARPEISIAYIHAPRTADPIGLILDDNQTVFSKKDELRPFYPGLNLHSFLYFGGFYPNVATLDRWVSQAVPAYRHNDLAAWNWVLTAGEAVVIDKAPDAHGLGIADALQVPMVREIIRMCGYVDHTTLDDGLEFRHDGNGLGLLLSGWSEPDKDGVWSEAERALVALPGPVKLDDETFEIALEVSECDPAVSRELRLSLNGEAIGSIVGLVVEKQVYSFNLPARVWNLHLPAMLEIYIRDSGPQDSFAKFPAGQMSKFKLFDMRLIG